MNKVQKMYIQAIGFFFVWCVGMPIVVFSFMDWLKDVAVYCHGNPRYDLMLRTSAIILLIKFIQLGIKKLVK